MKTQIELSDDELMLLDGQVNSSTQEIINQVKTRRELEKYHGLTATEAKFISDVVHEANTKGKLVYRVAYIRICDVCKRDDGYNVYFRSTKYKRKGDPNYNSPKVFAAVELADRFVIMKNYVTLGACMDCFNKLRPALQKELELVRAEIPAAIMGYPPKYKVYDNRKCTKCGWRGHEGQMKHLPAVMGGTYPGGCPQCGVENIFFGPRNIVSDEGNTVVAL